MGIKLKNNARSTLLASITAADTVIVLESGGGNAFPTLSAGEHFFATIVATSGSYEIVDVTARSGDILTVTRAAENTTATAFPAGSLIELRVTAGTITEAVTAVTSINVSGGTTGLTFTGGPITTSGMITAGGTLGVTNGGTGATTLTGYVKGSGTSALTASATIPGSDISGNISGNATNVTGTVAVVNGGTGTTTAFTAGSVVFAGASGVYSQDNANLFWDDTNNRLGVGTASPNAVLTINAADPRISFFPADPTYSVYRSGTAMFLSSSGSVTLLAVGGVTTFNVNGSERVRITTNGNMGVGTSSPDSLGRLAVVAGTGTALYVDGVTNALVGDFRNTGANSYGVRIVAGQNGLYALSVQDKASNPLLLVDGGGKVGIGESSPDYRLDVNGTFGFTPGSSVTPVDNGDVVFELTNNTTLTIKAKGSDGVVRSGTITLA